MKLEEARRLRVGDVVCDCRYKHLKIIEIFFDDECSSDNIQLTLEDGAVCSAERCCDVVPHEWLHPNISQEKS